MCCNLVRLITRVFVVAKRLGSAILRELQVCCVWLAVEWVFWDRLVVWKRTTTWGFGMP